MELEINSVDNVFIQISCEPSLKMELNHYFRFRPNNYQFMPMFRAKKWDGYVYLFNYDNGKIYSGLKQEVYRFANDREYGIKDNTVSENPNITNEDYFQFLTSFPCEYKQGLSEQCSTICNRPRDVFYFHQRLLKSLIIYYLMRYYFPRRTLIIVPTLSLVNQMYSDFDAYADKDLK